MSSSDLSELSSSPLTDDDEVPQSIPKGKLEHYFKVGASALPPKLKKKRPPSPPHEYVLADNPDIAFICMFRSRFADAFSKSLPHYGPQDIERGVVDSPPGDHIERLLCALLGLLLNRKKEVEKGHYSRALEEAIQAHKTQWAETWEGKNPLHGGGSFNNMTPEQRLTLLRTLILWSLDSSDVIRAFIKDSYKQSRHEDDLNQPLSVQSWGRDGDKRRYWLIEGQDDTHFRLYRESNPALKTVAWRSMAGDIDEVRFVAKELKEEGSQAAVRLHDRIMAAIPRFEASEDKRKRRDYRLARRAQFTRPEPGFSLYEGRTRGKRPRYTYSDDEGGDSDVVSAQRSMRPSGVSTPAEPAGPTFTASGRQVKSRHGGAYGESMLSGNVEDPEPEGQARTDDVDLDDRESRSRARSQPAAPITKKRPGKHIDGYNELDEMDDESDAPSSGHDWDSGIEDEADDHADDDDDDDDQLEMSDDSDVMSQEESSADEVDGRSHSLVVSLRYSKIDSSPIPPDITNSSSGPKQAYTAPSSMIEQTKPADSTQDASRVARPDIVDQTSKHANGSPNQLPPTYLPTTTLAPISIESFKEYSNKMPATSPDSQHQQPSLDASYRPVQAPPSTTRENGLSHPSFQQLQPAEEGTTSINLQQYQYQPSTQ